MTGSRQRTFLAACPASYVWMPEHPSCRAAVSQLPLAAAARQCHRQSSVSTTTATVIKMNGDREPT